VDNFEIFKHLNYEKEPKTAKEFDIFFSKFAEKEKPETFSKMGELIKEAFNGKFDIPFIEWGEKLKLDRAKLANLFKK